MKIISIIKNKINPEKNNRAWNISYQIFIASFLLTTLCVVMEYFLPGFVTNWFNPLWFLLVLLISGMIVAFYD